MYLLLVASSLSVRFLAIVRFLFRPDVRRQVAVVVLWNEVSPTLGRTPTERCKLLLKVLPWAAQVAERAQVQVEGVTRPAMQCMQGCGNGCNLKINFHLILAEEGRAVKVVASQSGRQWSQRGEA